MANKVKLKTLVEKMNLKNLSKKLLKNLAVIEERRNFAPANEAEAYRRHRNSENAGR